ncbi:hypothetical protein RUND412_005804 [Rhizina undulata]
MTDASPAVPPSPHSRLGIKFPSRLVLTNLSAGVLGFTFGTISGSTKSALQFRAENSHRLPTTQKDWYFYHKAKNYRVAHGGIKQGLRSAGGLAVWVSAFVVLEDAVDRLRGRVDALGTVVSALAVAGGVAGWYRLSYGMAVRAAKRGLLFGVGFGLAQDILRSAKGDTSVLDYAGVSLRRWGPKEEVLDGRS